MVGELNYVCTVQFAMNNFYVAGVSVHFVLGSHLCSSFKKKSYNLFLEVSE